MNESGMNIMENQMDVECKSPSDKGDVREPSGDVPPKNTILGIWKDFGDRTTMHGLGRAISSRRIWLKVLWSLLVIVGACVAGRNVYETIVHYFTYPVNTIVELKSRRHMVFPAVTLCNLNPARSSALDEQIQKDLNRSVENEYRARKQETIFKVKVNKRYREDDEAKEGIYYTMSDMLVDCTFDLESCRAIMFKPVDNFLYGKCFTFNSGQEDRPPLTIARAGNRNGLILELDIQQDEYLPFISTTGLKVMVHPQEEMAFPEDDGITVSPGRATSIGIRKVTITRLPHPWGKCRRKTVSKNPNLNMFGKRTKYSTAVCEKTCYQRSVVKRCKCCDENYPCTENTLINIAGISLDSLDECNEANRSVLNCLKSVREDHASGLLTCMKRCFPPCNEETYRTNYAIGSWPAERFEKILISKARSLKKKQHGASKQSTHPMTSDFVSKNFLRLEVYFESFVEEVVLTNPAYDWNIFLSDIGGQLGLWLGFSIMTAIEILELLYDIIGFIIGRIHNFRNVRNQPANIS